jgi:hypothetical protein
MTINNNDDLFNLEPLPIDYNAVDQMVRNISDYDDIFANIDREVHQDRMAEVRPQLKKVVKNKQVTKLFKNVQRNSAAIANNQFHDNYKQFENVKHAFKRKRKSNFEPHIGLSSLPMDFILTGELPDQIAREVEILIALFTNLRGCKNVSAMMASLFLYIQTHTTGSVSKQVYTYVKDLIDTMSDSYESRSKRANDILDDAFDEDFSPHIGGDAGDARPEFLEMLSSLKTNWRMVVNNSIFDKIAKLVGVIVTLGLCNVTDLDFQICGFKLFEEEVIEKQMSSSDIVEAILGVVEHFAEGAWTCYVAGSMKPLFLGSNEALKMDQDYVDVMAMWDLVKNGNLKKIRGFEDVIFDTKLEKLIVEIRVMMSRAQTFEKKMLTEKLFMLTKMQSDYIAMKLAGEIRAAPLSIELFGASAQGKTTLGEIIEDILLASAQLPMDPALRTIIKPEDKFAPNMKTSTVVVRFDDFANGKPMASGINPTQLILDYCNNQVCYANKPEAGDKGKTFIEPHIVMLNTNKKNLNASAYSNCPFSIQRRMMLVLTVRAKIEVQRLDREGRTCGIDATKVKAYYKSRGY